MGKREASLSQDAPPNGGNPTKTCMPKGAEALKRKAEPSSQWRPVKLVESAAVTAAASSPRRVREQKTSEEVQPTEAKLEDGQEKEDGNKASQKVAKREKEVETSESYYSSDDEKSEEEEEVVLKGKANSPAKTFLGEMPALTLDSSKEKERIPLLSKGSYRAVFCASGERRAGLESG